MRTCTGSSLDHAQRRSSSSDPPEIGFVSQQILVENEPSHPKQPAENRSGLSGFANPDTDSLAGCACPNLGSGFSLVAMDCSCDLGDFYMACSSINIKAFARCRSIFIPCCRAFKWMGSAYGMAS